MITHIVRDNDTLRRIALHYYGTPDKWRRIFSANINTIATERNRYEARRELEGPLYHWIFPGTCLVIPPETKQ